MIVADTEARWRKDERVDNCVTSSRRSDGSSSRLIPRVAAEAASDVDGLQRLESVSVDSQGRRLVLSPERATLKPTLIAASELLPSWLLWRPFPATPDDIPTLSEWALGLLLLPLAGAGVARLRRRSRRSAPTENRASVYRPEWSGSTIGGGGGGSSGSLPAQSGGQTTLQPDVSPDSRPSRKR